MHQEGSQLHLSVQETLDTRFPSPIEISPSGYSMLMDLVRTEREEFTRGLEDQPSYIQRISLMRRMYEIRARQKVITHLTNLIVEDFNQAVDAQIATIDKE